MIEQSLAAFNAEKHLRNFADVPWEPMYSDKATPLQGIRGKTGATEIGSDGLEIGADLVELQPGAAFPLHTHPGDHILYGISGVGTITIDGIARHVEAGTTVYVAGMSAHNVATYAEAIEPFVLLVVGHPKKHVSATDRLQIVE